MVTNGERINHIEEILVESIEPSRFNRHVSDDDADIRELAQTINQNGLICPISVRPHGNDHYEIICGERRWRAFRFLHEATIPCFVKELDDTEAQIERIVENYQRRDPTYLEQGEAVAALMDLTAHDVTEIANRLGQSVTWVYRRARLPNLIPAWRDELAKETTPYFHIRKSVNQLEEIAILPPSTQQLLLEQNTLRGVRTVKDMRKIIGRYCMNLEEKPWTRDWERKAYSGSSKKRCSDCMKRTDRNNALFPNPDEPDSGKKMCMNSECWRLKCLSWCKHLINENPGMVPIHESYGYGADDEKMKEYFGVTPIAYWRYQSRDDEEEEKDGYCHVKGVYVDGPNIGTEKSIWLPERTTLEDDEEENSSADADVQTWRRQQEKLHQTRQIIFAAMCPEIVDYLRQIDLYAPATQQELFDRKLRTCCWFGIGGNQHNDNALQIDDPTWQPLDTAWSEVLADIAEVVARSTVDTLLDLSDGEDDRHTAHALCSMFAIPTDMIATKAINATVCTVENVASNEFEEKDNDSIDDILSDEDSIHYPDHFQDVGKEYQPMEIRHQQ